jgi:hypothetical protein
VFWEVSSNFCGHGKIQLCDDMIEDQAEDAYFQTATRVNERRNTCEKEMASRGRN